MFGSRADPARNRVALLLIHYAGDRVRSLNIGSLFSKGLAVLADAPQIFQPVKIIPVFNGDFLSIDLYRELEFLSDDSESPGNSDAEISLRYLGAFLQVADCDGRALLYLHFTLRNDRRVIGMSAALFDHFFDLGRAHDEAIFF